MILEFIIHNVQNKLQFWLETIWVDSEIAFDSIHSKADMIYSPGYRKNPIM